MSFARYMHKGLPCFYRRKIAACILTVGCLVVLLLQIEIDQQPNEEGEKIYEELGIDPVKLKMRLPQELMQPITAQKEDIPTQVFILGPNQSINMDEVLKKAEDKKPLFLKGYPNYKHDPALKCSHNITIKSTGRLGNSMFAYASMFGIAETNHHVPVLSESDILRKYFHISAKPVTSREMEEEVKTWPKFQEDSPCIYDWDMTYLNYELNVELVGFLQSWKYFDHVKEEIRKEFQFKEEILQTARRFIRAVFHRAHSNSHNTTVIGIHVRRGDMTEFYNTEKGYTVATKRYIETAVTYFESIYSRAIFVVCTDDIMWSRQNVRRQRSPMYFAENYEDYEDLAILSLCNHTIVTVGTFSWWAGWLAGGKVVYYANFPSKSSLLADVFNAEDYFPPAWVPLY